MKTIDIFHILPQHPIKNWVKRKKKPTRIVVHCTASDNQDPYKTARYHITPSVDNHLCKSGAPGLAYHDFITSDGTIYHCNNYMDITWHCGLYNASSIGIVIAYRGQDCISPSSVQYSALIYQIKKLCATYNISVKNVIGHREAPWMSTLGKGGKKYKKTCPGMAIDLDQMRIDINV